MNLVKKTNIAKLVGEDNDLGNIGQSDQVTEQDVIQAFVDKYSKDSGLTTDDLEIFELEKTSAIVKAKETSEKFTGEVKVEFNLNVKEQLDQVIKKTSLGELANKDAKTFLDRVKKINDKLDDTQVDVKDINGTSAKIVVKENSTKYEQGSVDVTFTIAKTELKDVIKKTSLGELANKDAKTILDRVKKLNNALDEKEVEVKDIKDKSAKIEAKSSSKKYKDSFNVTFTIAKIELKEIIKTTNLGELANKDAKTILDRVKKLNNALDEKEVEVKDITIEKDENISAKIVAKKDSIEYKGEAKVTFTIADGKVHLDTIITKIELGKIHVNNQDQIKKRILELNKNIDKEDFQVMSNFIIKTETEVWPSEKGSKKYKGKIVVKFTAEKHIVQIRDYVKVKYLGGIKENTEKAIMFCLLSQNAKEGARINEDDVFTDIGPKSAVLQTKSNSELYQGSVEITYYTE